MTTDFQIFIGFLFLIQEQPTFLVTIIFFISNDIWISADAELKVSQNFVHFHSSATFCYDTRWYVAGSLKQRNRVGVRFMLTGALGTTLPWMLRVIKRTKRRRICPVPDRCTATHACRPSASIWIQIHCPLCPLNYGQFSLNLRVHFLSYERSCSEPGHWFPCWPRDWDRY